MADISKITVLDGTTYNIKDATARGSIPSAATATPLMDGTAAVGTATKYAREDHRHPVDTSRAASSHTHSANDLVGTGYINTHPENNPTVIPFINNDLAFLTKRGGTAIVKYDGVEQTGTGVANAFDGSGNYWSVNNTSVTTIVVELTLHKTFTYGNIVYVDFGAAGWRAKNIKIEVMNTSYASDVWTQKYSTTNNSLGHVYSAISHQPVGASNTGAGFNKMRFTFTDWGTSSSSGFRVSQIGLLGYSSPGTREPYMSRGADDPIFRSITPQDNNTYDLGSSTKKWSNVYATTFTGNLTGDVTGTATKATTATTANNVATQGSASASTGRHIWFSASDETKRAHNDSFTYTPSTNTISANITGDAGTVSGHTVAKDVPADAKFTDTTYESKAAASGGTAVSLVTTGEKYTWNNKSSLTLGTTSSTAYRGDYGNAAYTHGVTNKGSAFSSGMYKITTNSEGHVTAATAVAKADITALGIPAQDTTYESKTAASGGTDVSLVTTGEKYTWNNKSSLTLGTTSSTAYRGDRGASAYAHAVTNKGSAFSSGLYKITTNSEGHVTAASAVQKSDITALGIPAQDTTYTPASADPIGPKNVAEVGTSAKYAREDHVHPIKMVPIATKTYTNVIATANDNNGAGFFYLKVRPTTYNSYWHVKTRVVASVPGYANYYTDTTFDVYGYDNTITSYECLNRIKTTSYRPIYYNSVFLTKSTGYNNGCGHWIGVNLTSSTNPTSSSYKRTLEVELLACDNCTAELQDNLVTPTNIPNRSSHTDWYTSTNTSYSNYDAYTYGLRQSGDANTTSISNLIRNNGYFVADSAVYRYQMLFQKDTNTLTPLNNADNTTGTGKTMLTNVEFNPFGFIYYYASTTTISAAGNISGGAQAYAYNGLDLRYTFNCGTTLTAHRPFYLVVTPTGPESCKIASSSPWTQTLPTTNDGKWYIYLGRTYSTYQLALYPEHPVYFHDGTSVKQMLPPSAGGLPTVTSADNGKILNVTSGAWAKSDFTLDDIFSVVISETEPTSTHINGWIDPTTDAYSVPQINNSEVSSVDTYSSSKINSTYLAFGVSQTLTEGQMTQLYANMGFPSNTVGKLGYTVVT